MGRRTTQPTASSSTGVPPANPSGPFVYGAGHRAVRETLHGREYYESGGVSREWTATHERLELDPRLLPRTPSRWFSRFVARAWRLVRDFMVAYLLLSIAVGSTWAGWALGGFTGACVGLGVVALMYAIIDETTSAG